MLAAFPSLQHQLKEELTTAACGSLAIFWRPVKLQCQTIVKKVIGVGVKVEESYIIHLVSNGHVIAVSHL